MKKMIFTILVFFIALQYNHAQDNVDFSGQLRIRSHFDDRDFNSDKDGFTFTEMRTRVGAKFSPYSDLTAFFQIQDSRIFGTEPNTLTSTQNIDLHQAYFLAKNVFNVPLEIKAGRMEFNLGPQRLIGAVGWHNTGRSFDGGLATFRSKKADLHAFGFQVNETFNEGDSLDQSLGGV